MDMSTLLIVAMALMMVLMMGGMVVGGAWATSVVEDAITAITKAA